MVQDHNLTSIACLGVDFMAESVSAILQRNGYNVPVYRLSSKSIGCSLAASAETDSYRAWLQQASTTKPALHVVYINTSLETKATSSRLVPTIACTSSNVIKTLLQASTQIPDVQIYFGPDTYMGQNIKSYLDFMGEWSDARIAQELHPAHNQATLRALKDNIHVFPQGNCIVHHMFGSEVVQNVHDHYEDAYVTAHLEVPNEMFNVAMEKMNQGRGVVGSTSDILKFISNKVQKTNEPIQFILGTEAGMVTSIINKIQQAVVQHPVEIVFPVKSFTPIDGELVPGATEGCSTSGGCATCPFMKMNDVNALEDLLDHVLDDKKDKLLQHLPANKLTACAKKWNSSNDEVMDLAVDSIMNMRYFMNHQALSNDFVQKITN